MDMMDPSELSALVTIVATQVPNATDDAVKTALAECKYDALDAISALLGLLEKKTEEANRWSEIRQAFDERDAFIQKALSGSK